jgi:hypothetical protein
MSTDEMPGKTVLVVGWPLDAMEELLEGLKGFAAPGTTVRGGWGWGVGGVPRRAQPPHLPTAALPHRLTPHLPTAPASSLLSHPIPTSISPHRHAAPPHRQPHRQMVLLLNDTEGTTPFTYIYNYINVWTYRRNPLP